MQFHLQVSPQDYAYTWNAAQSIAGVQLALGPNSPFLFGKELWRETRIALFEQATDTRPEELKTQGVRPRVWFGERWITSIFDQFEENVSYFPAMLPVCDPEDPVAVLGRARPRGCRNCGCTTAPSTGGTGRCMTSTATSRTCGGEPGAAGRPDRDRHPGQRSVLLRPAPGWPRRTGRSGPAFPAAEDNFYAGARHGIDAKIYWPGSARCRPPSWCYDTSYRLAHQGLAAWGVDSSVSRPAAGRHRTGAAPQHINGAEWQARRLPPASTRRSGRWTGATHCGRCCAATSNTCTPTNRCTLGRRPEQSSTPPALVLLA